MKKSILFLGLAISAFLCSCSSKKEEISVPEAENIFINTFESVTFWGNNDPRIKKAAGHSGNFVCVLDSVNPFSVTFEANFGKISPQPLKILKASAFVKAKNTNASVSFGAQIVTTDPNGQPKTIYLSEAGLEFKTAKINEWTQLKFEAQLPANTMPTDIVKVFAFDRSKEEILVDDIIIKFE
jgi:hypothetical protein